MLAVDRDGVSTLHFSVLRFKDGFRLKNLDGFRCENLIFGANG